MAKLKTGSMITLELFPGKALVAGDCLTVSAFLRLAFRHGFSVTDADGKTSIQWQSAEKGA